MCVQFRQQCGTEDGETKKVLRCVQMYIDEDLGNRLLNKSKTILIWILSVTLVFLYFRMKDAETKKFLYFYFVN